MTNAILAWDNHVDRDNVVITPSSEVSTLPGSHLIDPHVSKPWRSTGEAPQTLTIDLDDQRDVAIVALIGTNLTASSTWRIQASTSDPTMGEDEVYDSGVVSTGIDPRYGLCFLRLPDDIPVTARYWLITLDDPNLTYLQAGRLFIGPSYIPSRNYSYGWHLGYVDLGKRTRSRGGQFFIDRNARFREATLTFELIDEDDAFEAMLEIERVCGTTTDVLVVGKPDAANPGRHTIWGLMNAQGGISETSFEIYTKNFTIEERL